MAMAMPTPTTTTQPLQTTIDSLKDDNIEDILLRLPSPVAITRAALAFKRWLRVASDPGFLRLLRERHPSPPIGFFTVSEEARIGIPSFRWHVLSLFDRDMAAIARRADFSLTSLEDDPEWRLRDCRDGRLLLARGNKSLDIYGTISRRRVTVRRPHNDPFPDVYIADCFLENGAAPAASFRVVSVQRHGRSLRAVEYASGGALRGWRFHQWVENIWPHYRLHPAMHAAGRIFFKSDSFSTLCLNTNTMEFSVLPLPARRRPDRYCVGETDDGACCLVCIDDRRRRLQVWLLGEDGNGGGNAWELEKERPVTDQALLGGYDDDQVWHVGMVAAGLVDVWGAWREQRDYFYHNLVDLKTMSLINGFASSNFLAYPLRMPWPPAALASH